MVNVSILLQAVLFAVPQPSSIEGDWINPRGSTVVRIEPCAAKHCGVIVWVSAPAMADAARAGAATLVGTQVLKDFAPAGPGQWRGSIFVPDLRQRGRGKLRQIGPDELELVGCQLGGLVCKKQRWRRVPGTRP